MNPITRLPDSRIVSVDRRSRDHAAIVIDDDGTSTTIGHVKTLTKPRKNAAMTQAMTMKFGRGVARSMGYGEREVYHAYDVHGRRIGHDYDHINDAALALAKSVTL